KEQPSIPHCVIRWCLFRFVTVLAGPMREYQFLNIDCTFPSVRAIVQTLILTCCLASLLELPLETIAHNKIDHGKG
ncbi:hypothetical protein NDU88_008545, partial [Pleurodeles waltl]